MEQAWADAQHASSTTSAVAFITRGGPTGDDAVRQVRKESLSAGRRLSSVSPLPKYVPVMQTRSQTAEKTHNQVRTCSCAVSAVQWV
jgi:hypothetical protein